MLNAGPTVIISYLLVLFLGIGIHEYAHCKFADLAGDPTPSYYGRVTLNLFKHFEPIGTLMMVLSAISGFGLGWGRPAPMDASKMKNPRWDFFIAVAAGPISNLCQAILYSFFLRLALANPAALGDYHTEQIVCDFLYIGVEVNVTLFLFNLIPFGPLDGHWLLGLLMPERPRFYWFRFCQRVGMLGLFVILVLVRQVPAASYAVGEKIQAVSTLLIGKTTP
jgi:Zn-dependent protease